MIAISDSQKELLFLMLISVWIHICQVIFVTFVHYNLVTGTIESISHINDNLRLLSLRIDSWPFFLNLWLSSVKQWNNDLTMKFPNKKPLCHTITRFGLIKSELIGTDWALYLTQIKLAASSDDVRHQMTVVWRGRAGLQNRFGSICTEEVISCWSLNQYGKR